MCDGKTIMEFMDKNRIFDPTKIARYANDLGQPYLLLKHNPVLQINQMHVGLDYGGNHIHDGFKCADQNTVVMVIGAREMKGHTAGARWFGQESKYNRQTFVTPKTNTSMVDHLLDMACAGCNSIREIMDQNKQIKKGYIMTSSDALIEGVKNLFGWTKNGFPEAPLPDNMSQTKLALLRGHLQNFDTLGLQVKFWKVAPEFITGPSFHAECALLDFLDVPTGLTACHCPNCIDDIQYRELKFAKIGMACCPCQHGKSLATRYGNLKKGDKFVITNNVGVTEATVTMRVDGKGMNYEHPS